MNQQQQPQYTFQQFPNFTHPPPPLPPTTTIDPFLPPVDDAIIERFLIDRNHSTIQVNENPNSKMTGSSTTSSTTRHRVLNVIQTNLNNLMKRQTFEESALQNDIAQLSPDEWNDKINSLKQNQNKIIELLTKFETLMTEELTKEDTKKKRRRRRNKRKNNKKKSGPTTHKVIEEVSAPRPKFEDDLAQSYEKYEIERLRTANTKRMNDCKRQLNLLDSLIELRSIRRKNCNVNGSGKKSTEKCFIDQIDQLKIQWTDALEKCTAQENQLRMLQTNTSSQLWSNALFSNVEPSLYVDEVMDFKTLLDIRKSWDLCLVGDDNVFGSSIPPGWVLPNSTPSAEWALYSG